MQDDLLTGFDLRKEPDCHHGVWPARPPGEIKPESLPHLPKKKQKNKNSLHSELCEHTTVTSPSCLSDEVETRDLIMSM